MSSEETSDFQAAVERFWANYLLILQKNAVSPKAIPWYRKHVEAYINANKNVHLKQHTGEDIDHYLNAKGRLPDIKEWQFRQMADALRLLFVELVRPQWSQTYD